MTKWSGADLAVFSGHRAAVEEEVRPVGEGRQPSKICAVCMDIHGRDTSAPVQCPTCKAIVGCFWHRGFYTHIRNCRNA